MVSRKESSLRLQDHLRTKRQEIQSKPFIYFRASGEEFPETTETTEPSSPDSDTTFLPEPWAAPSESCSSPREPENRDFINQTYLNSINQYHLSILLAVHNQIYKNSLNPTFVL